MALRIGDSLGPYRIVKQAGQGGMATVYLAHHQELGRDVAVKVMHQAMLDDPNFIVRFKREAQIVAQLEHPHIIPIYDYNEFEGQPYLIMKFVAGHTLKYEINQGALSLERILHIMTPIADALTYAHNKGVLHRDVKPSNIVIDQLDVPYLTDFGLARITQAGESTLSQDMLIGTPNYMSPEQGRGVRELDARTDIYSLGIILYELIVGDVPYKADTPYAVIHDHIYTPLPMPRVINPSIAPEVEAVLAKALAKQPSERYASANALMNDFRAALKLSNTTSLAEDRVERANVSLSQFRDLPLGEVQQVGISSPYVLSSTASSRAARYFPHARRWLVAGMLTFIFFCLASVGVGISALSDAQHLNRIAADALIAEADVETLDAANALLIALNILNLTEVQAQAALAEAPNDDLLYMALYRAFLITGQTQDATTALRTGFATTPDQVIYMIAAARLAKEYANPLLAGTCYTIAFELTPPDSPRFMLVRAEAGEFLYSLAQLPNLPDVTTTMSSSELGLGLDMADHTATLLQIMQIRKSIAKGDIETAAAQFNENEATIAALPEARLVRGELYLAQGDQAAALAEWQGVAENTDAPAWAQHRARELIKTIQERE